MAPSNHHITTQLRQLIYYNLDCNLLRNALFLAGRLHAYEPRASEAAYLLALCHLRLGQLKAAYDYSKSPGSRGTHLGCSYVFAQACLGLERYQGGLTALERSRGLWAARNNWNKHTDTRRQHVPDAAAVLCLQGKLLQAYEDFNRAIDCYAESLKLNPFMWDAFLGLCDLGVNVRIPNIFKMTPEMMSSMSLGTENQSFENGEESPHRNSFLTRTNGLNQQPPPNDPFSVPPGKANGDNRAGKIGLFEKLNDSTSNLNAPINTGPAEFDKYDTPVALGNGIAVAQATRIKEPSVITVETLSIEPPLAPARKPRWAAGLGMDLSMDAPPKMKASRLKAKTSQASESEETDVMGAQVSASFPIGIADRKRTISGQAAQAIAKAVPLAANQDPSAPQRRSARLISHLRPQSKVVPPTNGTIPQKEDREIKKARGTISKGRANQSTVGRVVSGNRKHGDPMDIDAKEPRANSSASIASVTSSRGNANNDRAKEHESLQWLLDLFTKLGSGYFALSHYRCLEAIQILSSINPPQRDTPWVQAQMGRALYEQGSHAEAEKYFARVRTMAPSRMEDMEVYSTVLWHLKAETDLSFLAHEMRDADQLAPQTWCAVGNSFSLQREHDQALKCFKRAIQLDSKFAYAHTLQGHEHVANEEYDRALTSYRRAIAADSRHYNAWYGLGRVFEKQGKYEDAERHYRIAASINPTNAVLICCIGVILEKLKRPQQALEQYTKSCELAPRSALSRFKKARVLMALGLPAEALEELNVLKDMAPDEANVHFLLGRCYKVLRRKGEAIRHFTTALNLDPKASHHIKNAMEQMEIEDDEDGDME